LGWSPPGFAGVVAGVAGALMAVLRGVNSAMLM